MFIFLMFIAIVIETRRVAECFNIWKKHDSVVPQQYFVFFHKFISTNNSSSEISRL